MTDVDADVRSSAQVRMGPEFTLLRFDPAADAAPLVRAAGESGVPLKLLDVAVSPAMADDACRVLSRPDAYGTARHRAPADPLSLIDRIRGAF